MLATPVLVSLRFDIDGRVCYADAAAEPGSGDKAKAADIVKASFFMAAKEVAAMLRQGGMTEDELLRSLIVPASKLARPYISRYFVGYVMAQLCSISIARSRCHMTVSFDTHATAPNPSIGSVRRQGRGIGRERQCVLRREH